jgi:RNA polymerase sigma factor for flagellar operon FliA
MYTAKGQLDAGVLLKQYSPLVRRLAHQMIAKLPANVELDDLIQVGMIGLSDALSRFDASQGVQFETFATQRIRGAMLDELRGNDWMSRGDRRHQRSIEAAVHKLEQRLGRPPTEGEIAREMGLSLTDYQDLLGKVRGTQLIYLEDMSGDEGRRRLPGPARAGQRLQPDRAAAGPAHARSAGCCHQEPART